MPKSLKSVLDTSPAPKAGTTYLAYAIVPKKGLHCLRTFKMVNDQVESFEDTVEDLKIIQIGKLNMEMDT